MLNPALLIVAVVGVNADHIDYLLRRHAEARSAVMQVYAVAETYDTQKGTLLFRRRYAMDQKRSRLAEFWAPDFVNIDPSLRRFERMVVDYYTDGKFCYHLNMHDVDAFPVSLSAKQSIQRRIPFTGMRCDFHPGVFSLWKDILDVRSLRKLSSFCLASAQGSRLYLEELIPHCERVKLRDKVSLELYFSSRKGNVRRERILVCFDPEHDYAIRKIHSTCWGAGGEVVQDSKNTVSKFVRINGVCWPVRIEWVARAPDFSRAWHTMFSEVVINQPLPPEAFDFRIPENAVIMHYDPDTNETKQVLIYGKNNQVARTFTPEEYNEYLQQKVGLGPGPHPAENGALWPVVATLGLLVLAGGLALWWRRAAGAAPTEEESTGN